MKKILAALKDPPPERMALYALVLLVASVAGFGTLAVVETGQWIGVVYIFTAIAGLMWLYLLLLRLVKRTDVLSGALSEMAKMADEFSEQAREHMEDLAAGQISGFAPPNNDDEVAFFVVGSPITGQRLGVGFRFPGGRIAVDWFGDEGLATYTDMDEIKEEIPKRLQRAAPTTKLDENTVA